MAKKSQARVPTLRVTVGILAGSVFVLALILVLFDWDWLRGPLERYLVKKSHREVRFDELQMHFGGALEPTLILRGVYVANASWAAKQPMVVAGEAAFTFSLRSLWEQRPIISRLVLKDADIDMELQADGLRNWRLTQPDDRSPGRVKVLTLEAHRTRIRFVNALADIKGVAEAGPAQDVTTSAGRALSTRIAFNVTHGGTGYAGVAHTGEVLSFRESGLSFPLKGYVASGKIRFDVDGMVADIFDISAIDAKVRITGPTLSGLNVLLPSRFTASRPFEAEAWLAQSEKQFTAVRMRGKIGDTDIRGNANYDRREKRPFLWAELVSETADLADLSALAGINYPARANAPQSREVSTEKAPRARNADSTPSPQQPLGGGSQHKLFDDGLKSADAYVTVETKKLRADGIPALENLRFTADLADGLLRVTPFDLGVAGGRVQGTLTLNAQQQTPSLRAAVDIGDVQLQKLLPATDAKARGSGRIMAQLRFAGAGKSIAAMLGDSTGSVTVIVDRGRIPRLFEAKVGLDLGKMVGAFFRQESDVALNCGALSVVFRNGVGKSRTLLVDTEHTSIEGNGTLDLREQRVELLLTPHPKQPGLFTLNSSIAVHGTFKDGNLAFDNRLVSRSTTDATTAAASYTAFAPLMDAAQWRKSACARVLGRNSGSADRQPGGISETTK